MLLHGSDLRWPWGAVAIVYIAACVLARRLPPDEAVPDSRGETAIRYASRAAVVLALAGLNRAALADAELVGAVAAGEQAD